MSISSTNWPWKPVVSEPSLLNASLQFCNDSTIATLQSSVILKLPVALAIDW